MMKWLGALCVLLLWAAPASAQISGEVIYTGTESGNIFVEAFTDQDQAFEKLVTDSVNPGPFEFMEVPDGSYTVIAFVDVDGNTRLDSGEPWAGVEDAEGELVKISVPPGDDNVTLNIDTYSPPSESGGEGSEDDGGCATTAPDGFAGAMLFMFAIILVRRTRPRFT